MKKKTNDVCCEKISNNKFECNGAHGAGYCLGVIGAAVYFISKAVGFWAVVLAILKSIVWPVFVVYGLLKFFGI